MYRTSLAAALGILLYAAPLSAQFPNTRQGFWIGFGLGYGSIGADCQSCGTDRTGGGSGYLRLGGTLSRSFQLGFESNGWFHSSSVADETMGFGSLIANVYPSGTGAFFLKIGLGGMTYKADDGANELTATAPSGSLGVGYDFRIGRNVSITPYLNSLASSAVSFKFNGVTVTGLDFKMNLVQLGVGLTWH